jgi:tripartite ATP-independent transporter DctP family solute receptor
MSTIITATRRAALLGSLGIFAAPHVARAQGMTLRFSHTDGPTGSRQDAAELFARRIRELTDGRVNVQVFHSGQLANDPRAVEQLQLGGIDFTVTAPGTYAPHHRPLNLSALPFLVDSYEQGWALYDEGRWMQAQFAQLVPKGIRIIATWEAGFRSFTTKMPIATPADARGHKMRVFPNDMIRWIMEAMGWNPVVLPVTEVYLAIQQGTVVGQENPVDTIHSLRFYEVAPYLTLTQHVYSPIPLAVAERTWRRLSEADRAHVATAAKESSAFSRNAVKQAEAGQLRDMEGKGAKISRPNIAPWREAVQPVYGRARQAYGAEVDAVLAEAEAIRRARPAT